MRLRTDDDIYRARLVYLGPPGYTLPFQWPYAQYGLFATLCTALTGLGVVLTGGWKLTGLTIAAALILTRWIWQSVDPDRPARKVIRAAILDCRSVKPTSGPLPRLSAKHIRFSSATNTTKKTEVRR